MNATRGNVLEIPIIRYSMQNVTEFEMHTMSDTQLISIVSVVGVLFLVIGHDYCISCFITFEIFLSEIQMCVQS